MFKKKIEKVATGLIERGIIENGDKEIIIHGLTSGIGLIVNIITTVMLGFFFRLTTESIVFLISFSYIRVYAGGYHCKREHNCYIFSTGVVVIVLSVIKFTPVQCIQAIGLVMVLISVPTLLKLAPVETQVRVLDETEKTYFRRKTVLHICVECVVIAILLLLRWHMFAYVICVGLLVSSVLVLLGSYATTNES